MPLPCRPALTACRCPRACALLPCRAPQDPADKSFIVADGALKGLTGEARFKGFGFSKLIKEHITGYT